MNRGKIVRTSADFVAARMSDQRLSAEHGQGSVRIPSDCGLTERVDIDFGKDAAGMRLNHHMVLRVPR